MGSADVTTDSLVPEGRRYTAVAVAKDTGVVCGIEAATLAFTLLNPKAKVTVFKKDGDKIKPGDKIFTVEGNRSILTSERVALNFLQHLSGVSTSTAAFVEAVEGTTAVILDTRKTIPGLRELDKYAVKTGGGVCHRMGLYDAVLVKDNHIRAAGWERIAESAELWRKNKDVEFVEIEAQSLDEVKKALAINPDIILLDNFSLVDIKKAVKMIHALPPGKRPQIEISGCVNIKNVRAYAQTGADRISVGRITHSAPALDISLEIYDENSK